MVKKDPWAKDRCKDSNCIVCRQEGKSDCKTKGVVYKHDCLICKKEGRRSTYWGQTSKSLLERATEHDKEMKDRSDKSHAYFHIRDCHTKELDRP